MKQQPLYFPLAVFIIILFSFQACNNRNGDLPYDEGNVTENIISIKTAQAYTSSYRNGVTALSRAGGSAYLRDSFQLPVAVQFNKDVLALLMNQKDSAGGRAEGVRLYFARDARNQVTLVLIPYDRSNNDILNKLIQKDVARIPGITPAFAQLVEAQAVDNALRCPTFCDQAGSPLDGDLQPIPPQQ